MRSFANFDLVFFRLFTYQVDWTTKQISSSPRTLPDSTSVFSVIRHCVLRDCLQSEACRFPEVGSTGYRVVLWFGGFSFGLVYIVPGDRVGV